MARNRCSPTSSTNSWDSCARSRPRSAGRFKMIRNVTIIGTGLIGASFGLALRRHGFDGAIVGVSSARAIEDAVAAGAIDRGAPLEEAVASADLVFLSQTI